MNASAVALVDLLVDDERKGILKDLSLSLPDITLNERQLCDLELIATGVFSPLDRFMTRSDYESVLDRMRLQDGTLWPLPVTLDISESYRPEPRGGTVRHPAGSRGVPAGHHAHRRLVAGGA